MVWVDSIGGSDTTGLRGRFDKPFQSPNAAKTAAQVGDTVVVFPGNYTLTDSIAKNGVNWFGYPGATLNRTPVNETGLGIFDDNGSAMSYKVDGFFHLNFFSNATGPAQSFSVHLNHASSVVQIKCAILAAGATSDDVSNGNLLVEAGKLHIEADEITQTGMGYNVYWINGDMFVKANKIKSGPNIAISSDVMATPTGKLWVEAQEISASAFTVIGDGSGDAGTQTWVRALEIRNDDNNTNTIISQQGAGKLYVEAQKITGRLGLSSIIQNISTGKLWVKAMKISDAQLLISTSNGQTFVECQHLEPSVRGVSVTGGELFLSGQWMPATGGTGISVTGGTARISGLTVDTSSNNLVCPVSKTGGVLILNGSALRSHTSRNTISANSAQTVVAYRSYGSTAVHSNVTVSGDLTIGSYVV